MNQKVNISEGYSLKYLIHAFFIIIIGIVLFKVHFILAIAVTLAGVLLLFTKTGVVFDALNKNVKIYSSILGYKFGKTVDLTPYNQMRLIHKNETSKMQSRGPANTIRTKTYSLLLFNEKKQNELLHAFTKYELAKQLFELLTNQLNYNGVNEVLEQAQNAKAK